MSEIPSQGAFCYEDSLIIEGLRDEIRSLSKQNTVLRNQLQTQQELRVLFNKEPE